MFWRYFPLAKFLFLCRKHFVFLQRKYSLYDFTEEWWSSAIPLRVKWSEIRWTSVLAALAISAWHSPPVLASDKQSEIKKSNKNTKLSPPISSHKTHHSTPVIRTTSPTIAAAMWWPARLVLDGEESPEWVAFRSETFVASYEQKNNAAAKNMENKQHEIWAIESESERSTHRLERIRERSGQFRSKCYGIPRLPRIQDRSANASLSCPVGKGKRPQRCRLPLRPARRKRKALEKRTRATSQINQSINQSNDQPNDKPGWSIW